VENFTIRLGGGRILGGTLGVWCCCGSLRRGGGTMVAWKGHGGRTVETPLRHIFPKSHHSPTITTSTHKTTSAKTPQVLRENPNEIVSANRMYINHVSRVQPLTHSSHVQHIDRFDTQIPRMERHTPTSEHLLKFPSTECRTIYYEAVITGYVVYANLFPFFGWCCAAVVYHDAIPAGIVCIC